VVPVGVIPDIGLAAHDATQWLLAWLGVLAADVAGTMAAALMASAIPPRMADNRRVPGLTAESDFTMSSLAGVSDKRITVNLFI
jgi:hypothetical protein